MISLHMLIVSQVYICARALKNALCLNGDIRERFVDLAEFLFGLHTGMVIIALSAISCGTGMHNL